MKKIILVLCLVALITGCSSPTDKASKLISEFPYGTVSKLDSVITYPEVFNLKLKVIESERKRDSILNERLQVLRYLESKGDSDKMSEIATSTKEELGSMINEEHEYNTDAATLELKLSVSGQKPSFIGYSFTSVNDSCSYIVYFDKNVSKIICVEKEDK